MRKSVLMILPIETGLITLHADAALQNPIVAAGEFERGQWRLLEQWRPEASGSTLIWTVTPDRVLSIQVLADAELVEEAIRRAGISPSD